MVVFVLALFLMGLATPAHSQSSVDSRVDEVRAIVPQIEVTSHDMEVELDPGRHGLHVLDRVALKFLAHPVSLTFVLNQALHVSHIRLAGSGKDLPTTIAANGSKDHEVGTQRVTISLPDLSLTGQTLILEWQYDGIINDPPREPRHLRFVTPSETAGHIGPDGVYLSGETHWYPDLPGSLPTFQVRVITPKTWQAVTHGRETSHMVKEDRTVAAWEIGSRTEGLTLVANQFVKTHKDWRGIEIAAYLFPEDAPLAPDYLDASVRYLETYTTLLGPYPFPKFAVVENFFASGLGMPSFTLLGSGIIKRHYTQPYALGHEIVHSWIGNWVFNRPHHGNWVEGLTTYLANYYYEELTGTEAQAREQRRLMALGYALYVRPQVDYPINRFTHKTDQKDNAIGYQKTAMVFHMLRREIGEEAFWNGIRGLVREYGSAYADWGDVERAFATASHTDLRWFFAQWIERAGAPVLAITDARVQENSRAPSGRYDVRLSVAQSGTSYRVTLPVTIEMSDGQSLVTLLHLDSPEEVLSVPVAVKPVTVEVDPNFEVFRRLDRLEISPMLNHFVTDSERTVLLPAHGTDAERQPYQDLAKRLMAQDRHSPVSVDADDAAPSNASVLVLGGPAMNRAAYWAVSGCHEHVSLEKDGTTIEGHPYHGANLAFLISCPHPDHPDRIVTLFYGGSPSLVAQTARLLFFYGWQSYVVFQDGTIAARGNFSPAKQNLKVTF